MELDALKISAANAVINTDIKSCLVAGGWNPGLDDVATVVDSFPGSFFQGVLQDDPICYGSALCYDKNYAFLWLGGFEQEKSSIAHQQQMIAHGLQQVGQRCAGINCLQSQEQVYSTMGFNRAFSITRFRLQTQVMRLCERSTSVVPMRNIHQDMLHRYDAVCFPAPRAQLLNAWIQAPHAGGFIYEKQGKTCGYIVARQSHQGFRVGPLCADSTEIAAALLTAVFQWVSDAVVFIDVPDTHPQSLALITSLGGQRCFSCQRLYAQGKPQFDRRRIYAMMAFDFV